MKKIRTTKTLAFLFILLSINLAACNNSNNKNISGSTMSLDDKNIKKATFGSGCFWCTEAIFENVKGVTDVVSGYVGGKVYNPTYEQVCSGTTGHA
ncbi:MAG: peptide-methionine (S)-S-oxide reductase, partial [Ignavibacteriaceae bacterium]|nr:peptide-methionine (S)-S-oxide reductase [Ignavibacteriaceae bacterium]